MSIRVILDTCVVRNIAHQRGVELDRRLIHASSEDLRFSVADPSFLELHAALSEGRIPWEDWRRAATFFDDVLDEEWPVFPGNAQLHMTSGLLDGKIDVAKIKRHCQAGWQHVSAAESDNDLEREEVIELDDGRKFKIGGHPSKSPAVRENERAKWIKLIESLRETYDPKKWSQEDTMKAVLVRLYQEEKWSPEQLGKMVPFAKVIARYIHLVQRKGSYNPDSDNTRGDAFDLNLLWYLPLPALVCTADGKFIKKAGLSDVSYGVVNVETLNEHIGSNTVHELLHDVTEMQKPVLVET